MKVSLLRTFQFEAAHENRSPEAAVQTRRLHGHSYRVTVRVTGVVDETIGWLVDFAEIRDRCWPVIERLDHRILNEVDGIKDGSLADVNAWLRQRLQKAQPGLDDCALSVIGDTSFQPVSRNDGALSLVEFGFAAAHYLPNLPETHKCRRMHGHSYRIRIAGAGDSRMVELLQSLYPLVDHRVLNDIPGLENATAEHLSIWWWDSLRERGIQPASVLVNETCTSACLYRGEED